MVVTKAMLEQLRAERQRPALQLEYTIGGPVEAEVSARHFAQREKLIAFGEKTLGEALAEFRAQQAFSSRCGLAKAQFNHSQQESVHER